MGLCHGGQTTWMNSWREYQNSHASNYLGGAWRSLERWATKKPQSINLWGFSWHSLELCACILVGSTGTGVFG